MLDHLAAAQVKKAAQLLILGFGLGLSPGWVLELMWSGLLGLGSGGLSCLGLASVGRISRVCLLGLVSIGRVEFEYGQ